MLMLRFFATGFVALSLAALALHSDAGEAELYVTSTAYNSLESQTDATPSIAAWGDQLEPGMKAIAVSRDLLDLGLTRGSRIRIDGLTGEFVVLDKMAKRWQKRIDIYMGEDVTAARRYGKRSVRITWDIAEASDPASVASAGASGD